MSITIQQGVYESYYFEAITTSVQLLRLTTNQITEILQFTPRK